MRMPPSPLKAFFAGLPLFADVSGEALSRIAARAGEIDAPRRTVICRRGEPCRGIHIVISGQVKLSLQALQGDERVIELLGPGQSIGDSVLFADACYVSTAETLVDSRLAHIPKAAVLAELERNPRFARRMLVNVCTRLNHLVSDVEGYTLRTGTQRVTCYLTSQLTPLEGRSDPSITLPAKKGIIASYLNITHEHFSRILRELTVQGMIEVHGRVVRILDVERLRNFSG